MDKFWNHRSGNNSSFHYHSSPCHCFHKPSDHIQLPKYKNFFYFNDNNFFAAFDAINQKVQEIIHSREGRGFRSSLPETYYTVNKTEIIGGFVSTVEEFSIPNPFPYSRLVSFLEQNMQKISTIFHCVDFSTTVFKHQTDCLSSQDDFANLTKKLFTASIGFPFFVKFKLADFHNSIYTHYVANLMEKWAQIVFVNDPKQLEDFFYFAGNLDKRLRNCQFNRAKGLFKGPTGSDIFAEIFLTLIDFFIARQLKDKGIDFKCVRHHDQYFFFFSSRAIAEQSLAMIQTIFLRNKLNINFARLEKQTAPFNFLLPSSEDKFFSTSQLNSDNFRFLEQIQYLQKIDNLDLSSDATKHFLISLKTQLSSTNQLSQGQTLAQHLVKEDNLLVLFNLQLQRPDLTSDIVNLLVADVSQNSDLLNQFKNQLEKEILSDLKTQNADQEIVAQVYFADYLGIMLAPSVLEAILLEWEQVSATVILTVLFYLHKWIKTTTPSPELDRLWKMKDELLDKIFIAKKDWLDTMKQFGNPYTMIRNISQTELWLLLYEAVFHGWYNGDFKQTIINDPFFSFLIAKKISFLSPVQKNTLKLDHE